MYRVGKIPRLPHYRFSDTGLVWSSRRTVGCSWRRIRGRVDGTGRIQVVLIDIDGRSKAYLLHRLVLEAFIGPCPKGMEGCHRNGDYRDNRLRNLCWATHKRNMLDRSRHGRTARNYGEANGSAKLTNRKVRSMRYLRKLGWTYKQLMEKFGVSFGIVRNVCTNKTYRFA